MKNIDKLLNLGFAIEFKPLYYNDIDGLKRGLFYCVLKGDDFYESKNWFNTFEECLNALENNYELIALFLKIEK